jgi:hypothetical protein
MGRPSPVPPLLVVWNGTNRLARCLRGEARAVVADAEGDGVAAGEAVAAQAEGDADHPTRRLDAGDRVERRCAPG